MTILLRLFSRSRTSAASVKAVKFTLTTVTTVYRERIMCTSNFKLDCSVKFFYFSKVLASAYG